MTKRVDVVKRLTKAARKAGVEFSEVREGANHTVYSLAGVMIPIPRHRELDNRLAETIYKEGEGVLGKGWWRR